MGKQVNWNPWAKFRNWLQVFVVFCRSTPQLKHNVCEQRLVPNGYSNNLPLKFLFSDREYCGDFPLFLLQRTAKRCTMIWNARAKPLFLPIDHLGHRHRHRHCLRHHHHYYHHYHNNNKQPGIPTLVSSPVFLFLLFNMDRGFGPPGLFRLRFGWASVAESFSRTNVSFSWAEGCRREIWTLNAKDGID